MGGLGADHYNTRTSTSKRGRWDRLRVFSSMVVVVVLHVVDVVLWEWDVVVVLSLGGYQSGPLGPRREVTFSNSAVYSDRTNKPYINTDSILSVNFAIPVAKASL